MATTASMRLGFPVLLAAALSLFSSSQVDASGLEIRSVIDWTAQIGGAKVGLVEYQIDFFPGTGGDSKVVGAGMVLYFGFGEIRVPCRLAAFVVVVVGSIVGAVLLSMLPSLRRRWIMSRSLER